MAAEAPPNAFQDNAPGISCDAPNAAKVKAETVACRNGFRPLAFRWVEERADRSIAGVQARRRSEDIHRRLNGKASCRLRSDTTYRPLEPFLGDHAAGVIADQFQDAHLSHRQADCARVIPSRRADRGYLDVLLDGVFGVSSVRQSSRLPGSPPDLASSPRHLL